MKEKDYLKEKKKYEQKLKIRKALMIITTIAMTVKYFYGQHLI